MYKRFQESNKDEGGGAPPAPAPASTPEAPPSGEAFDFGSLSFEAESTPPPTKTPPVGAEAVPAPPAQPAAAETPTPSVAPAPVLAPVAAPQPPTPPPVAPVQAPVPPAAAPPATAEVKPSVEPVTFEKHRAEFLPKLRELYKLSPEQIEKVRESPEEVLPELAAQLHYEVQLSAYNSVLAVLPDIVGLLLDRRNEAEKANTEFYGMHPRLKEKVAADLRTEEVIRNSIRAYRTANPNADTKTVMQQAGILAMMALQMPLVEPQAPSVPPPAPRVPPPRPPGIGATSSPMPSQPAPGQEENIFADLVDDYLKEGP